VTGLAPGQLGPVTNSTSVPPLKRSPSAA